MGWRTGGGRKRPARRVVPYIPDVEALAADVAADLAYYGAQVLVDRAEDSEGLCDVTNIRGLLCIRRASGDWEVLLPGRQLVVGVDGGWRIEPVPAAEQVA